MLADAAKHKFDALIVWKTDRIGRNKEEIALNKYHLKKNGIKIYYVAESIPNTPEGIILESVIEGMAAYYSETFYKVQEMLKYNQRAAAHKNSKVDYLLTEKLFCGKCGNGMVGVCGTSSSGVRHHYYICTAQKKKLCTKKPVRQAWIENVVFVYDDKVVLTFNYSGDDRTITLNEIDAGLKQGVRIPKSVVHQTERGCKFIPIVNIP